MQSLLLKILVKHLLPFLYRRIVRSPRPKPNLRLLYRGRR